MDKWLREGLSTCLDFEVPDDMIKYVISMKSSAEFDEYFESLLNKNCEEHRLFLANCKQRLFSKALPNKKHQQQNNPKKAHNHGGSAIKQNISGGGGNTTNNKLHDTNQNREQNSQSQGAKKKTKYVSLYNNSGNVADAIMLKGRRLCNCQASQHKLVSNCLSCGRIVCEQEGSGPCLFCGELVCTNEELHVLKSSGKKSENLLKSLKEKGGGESLKIALEHRDRLLEYERNSEKRTTVIDDELDYFEENSVWHSEEQRAAFERLKQEMHERKHDNRVNRKIKIDFAGREVDDDATISQEYERDVLKSVAAVNAKTDTSSNWSNRNHSDKWDNTADLDPNLDAPRPIYRPSTEEKVKSKGPTLNDGLERIYNRVQDKELMEMQDMRQCLSLHQPWASLLVAGIKKHEGRIWYSEHRGRLWIASTAKEPRSEEIQQQENFYHQYYNDLLIKFPDHYPTGCLLGCVKVDDCFAQEEYRDIYPEGESDSPYVFVCSNPEKLPVVFPIKGQHKIFQIDPKIHNAACKTLMRMKATQLKEIIK